jgi:uncharacterized protein
MTTPTRCMGLVARMRVWLIPLDSHAMREVITMKFLLQTFAVVLGSLVGHWFLSFPVTDLLSAAYAEAKKSVAVDWQTLGGLDFRTGNKTPAVAQLVNDGVTVRVPGFMVPLEDDADAVTEFLLIPYFMACIHVPPPPPNQMVLVKMAGAKKQKVMWEPIWVQGQLRVTETSSKEVFYTMTGVLVERYE